MNTFNVAVQKELSQTIAFRYRRYDRGRLRNFCLPAPVPGLWKFADEGILQKITFSWVQTPINVCIFLNLDSRPFKRRVGRPRTTLRDRSAASQIGEKLFHHQVHITSSRPPVKWHNCENALEIQLSRKSKILTEWVRDKFWKLSPNIKVWKAKRIRPLRHIFHDLDYFLEKIRFNFYLSL